MAQTGVLAPRVVVRPPSIPAPPPLSLLTQGTTVTDDADVLKSDGVERWSGGGGATWLEPMRGFGGGLWQAWPEQGSNADGAKSDTVDVDVVSEQAPTQLPMWAVAEMRQGALQAFADERAGDSETTQEQRAFDALLPRMIEHELWTGNKADAAGWVDQFRLADGDHVDTSHAGTALGFLRALARAEGLAASEGIIDSFGGAMVHVSWALFGLIVAVHQSLTISPTGRQARLPSGVLVVPELGATGSWPGHGAAPGAGAGDDVATGYLFVTPPVRIRLGAFAVLDHPYDLSNDRIVVTEQPFQIEASTLGSEHPTSIAVAADYTKEF